VTGDLTIVPLSREHDVSSFSCGEPPIEDFLRKLALVNQANGDARTYVAFEETKVIGYYSLAASSVVYEMAPQRVAKVLARHEIPVILMARFAVDQAWQGKGLGRRLFFDALLRALRASESIGARAFFVHAKDEEAKAFYDKFEMIPAPGHPFHLFVLFKDVRSTFGRI